MVAFFSLFSTPEIILSRKNMTLPFKRHKLILKISTCMWVTYTESKVILEPNGPSIQSFVCVHIFSVDFKIHTLPHIAALPSAPWRFWGAANVTISKEHEREPWIGIQSRNLLFAFLPCWTSGDWLDGIFAPKAAVPLKVPFPHICSANLLRTRFIICLRVMKSPELCWATKYCLHCVEKIWLQQYQE